MNLESLVKNFKREWEDNHRIRYGLLFIAFLLFVFLVLEFQDILNDKKIDLGIRVAERTDIEAIESLEYWEKELIGAQTSRAKLREQLWSGASENLIKVAVQSQLLSISSDSRILNPKISVSESAELTGLRNHFSLSVSFEGLFKGGDFANFLSEIEKDQNRFVLERLKISTSPNPKANGRIELIATIFFIIGNKNAS